MSKRLDYSKLTHRLCRVCGETKPVAEFSRYKDASAPLTGWRYYSRCKSCNKTLCSAYGSQNKPTRNKRMRNWRKKNPEKAKRNDRNGRLKMHYGLSIEEVEAMKVAQNHECGICHRVKPLVVDHHHASGRVRLLLCQRCNHLVGVIENHPQVVTAALAYVENQPSHA